MKENILVCVSDYELYEICHPYYSHCIVTNLPYEDDVIAYKDKKTKIWHSTEYWISKYPDRFKEEFELEQRKAQEISKKELRSLIPEEELFMILL